MRVRSVNGYGFRLGKFTMWRNKNITTKMNLKESNKTTQKFVLNQKFNTDLYERFRLSRKGYFLGLSLFKNYFFQSNRLFYNKIYGKFLYLRSDLEENSQITRTLKKNKKKIIYNEN